jgi:hypothetical protein
LPPFPSRTSPGPLCRRRLPRAGTTIASVGTARDSTDGAVAKPNELRKR